MPAGASAVLDLRHRAGRRPRSLAIALVPTTAGRDAHGRAGRAADRRSDGGRLRRRTGVACGADALGASAPERWGGRGGARRDGRDRAERAGAAGLAGRRRAKAPDRARRVRPAVRGTAGLEHAGGVRPARAAGRWLARARPDRVGPLAAQPAPRCSSSAAIVSCCRSTSAPIPSGLSRASLPIVRGAGAPRAAGRGPVVAAVRSPAQTLSFLRSAGLLPALDVLSRAPGFLRPDLSDLGPQATIVAADERTLTVRLTPPDPGDWSTKLARLDALSGLIRFAGLADVRIDREADGAYSIESDGAFAGRVGVYGPVVVFSTDPRADLRAAARAPVGTTGAGSGRRPDPAARALAVRPAPARARPGHRRRRHRLGARRTVLAARRAERARALNPRTRQVPRRGAPWWRALGRPRLSQRSAAPAVSLSAGAPAGLIQRYGHGGTGCQLPCRLSMRWLSARATSSATVSVSCSWAKPVRIAAYSVLLASAEATALTHVSRMESTMSPSPGARRNPVFI